MDKKVKVIVLTGNGINCEVETAHACRLAGADVVDIVYLWDLASGKANLHEYQMLCLPGGFLDGDDLGSAMAAAVRIRNTKVTGKTLFEKICDFIGNGGLIIGICNGFQLMVKLGLLPDIDGKMENERVTLTTNESGRFEDRWVCLNVDSNSPCIFTKGIKRLWLPVRHGEGKLVFADKRIEKKVLDAHLGTLSYALPDTFKSTLKYPFNPNGSPHGIAALSSPTGRIFGLMPHPEAFLHRTNHPLWTRMDLPDEGDGLKLFQNAVDYMKDI